MKKIVKTLIATATATLLLSAAATPAMAAEGDSIAQVVSKNLAMFSAFSGIPIAAIITGPLFAAAVSLIIATVVTVCKLDKAIRAVATNTCEETVTAAAQAFNKVKGPIRWNICLGGESRGINFPMWRRVFNYNVINSRNVSVKAKNELRKGLSNLNTYGLKQVYTRQNTRKF